MTPENPEGSGQRSSTVERINLTTYLYVDLQNEVSPHTSTLCFCGSERTISNCINKIAIIIIIIIKRVLSEGNRDCSTPFWIFLECVLNVYQLIEISAAEDKRAM